MENFNQKEVKREWREPKITQLGVKNTEGSKFSNVHETSGGWTMVDDVQVGLTDSAGSAGLVA